MRDSSKLVRDSSTLVRDSNTPKSAAAACRGNKWRRREDAQITGIRVLQNLKLVVLQYYKTCHCLKREQVEEEKGKP